MCLVSCVLRLVSCVLCLVSCVLCLASCVLGSLGACGLELVVGGLVDTPFRSRYDSGCPMDNRGVHRGRGSAVERLLAKEKVVGSNPIARSGKHSAFSRQLSADTLQVSVLVDR